MKILIVDDEREEREGISFLIRKFEYPLDIVYAVNGEEALHIVETQKIDILFTDIEMPVMNGLELAKKVCNTYPGIKIIIFSAYGEFGYVKQALQANAVSYLLKPIEVEEFKQLMTAVIGSVCEVEKKEQLEKEEEKQNRKIVISYLILVLFPIIVLGIYSYHISKTKLIDQTRHTMEGNVSSITYSLENNIRRENDNIKYLSYNARLRERLETGSEDVGGLVKELNVSVEPAFWYFITSDDNLKGIEIFSPYIKRPIGDF